MHNFIKFIPLALAVFLLCGCSEGICFDTVDKSYESSSVKVNAKIPQITNLASEDLQNAVNEEFLSVTSELLEKFTEDAKKTGEMSEFDMNTDIHYNKNGILSTVVEYNYFSRSASKNAFRIVKNIDTENCVELSLCDLFQDDSYIDGLNNLLEDVAKESPEKYQELWSRPKISQNQRFFMTNDSLVLFYPPYELSYYERGFVEFPLPYDKISTYLKQEYREKLVK